jgi:hypothetical protein
MKNFLNNNRMMAFVLVLAIGSISGVITAQFVMGLDGDSYMKKSK